MQNNTGHLMRGPDTIFFISSFKYDFIQRNVYCI